MQISTFNKRHGAGSGRSILGVDADAMARLPHQVRGELIAALTEADDAQSSGNDALKRAATGRLTKLLGEIEARRSEAVAEKAFRDFMRPVRGDHAVIRKFVSRGGVSA